MIHAERRLLLAARRAELVQRAAHERHELAQSVLPLLPSWRRLERGLQLWRAVRERPWLLAIPAVALLWWRPRAALAALPTVWAQRRWLA